MAKTSISSSVSRDRFGIAVRYDPRLPDHSAFCWTAPLGIITFRFRGMWVPSELYQLRRVSDADLDLGVLEAEEAEAHDAWVVVDRESHRVDPRPRVQGRRDLIHRRQPDFRGERLIEGGSDVRAAELQRVGERLVEEPVPRESIQGGVVQPDE